MMETMAEYMPLGFIKEGAAMKLKPRRFSREERETLLQKYEVSGMNIKDYAQANGIARSTLYSWFLQLGPSHFRGNRKTPSVNNGTTVPISDIIFKGKQREYKKHDIFLTPVSSDISFVDITSQMSKDSISCSQQAARSLEPCGLEIQLPNGIRLKLEKVTFNQVWIQVVEWMRVKHHVI